MSSRPTLSVLPGSNHPTGISDALAGEPDCRQNVRQRLLLPAIKRANTKVLELGIEPIENVTLHGLRRTHASLRCAVGDDQAFTATRIGHDDPAFAMRVSTHAVKRRQRLSGAEVEVFTLANRVGAMGTFGRK